MLVGAKSRRTEWPSNLYNFHYETEIDIGHVRSKSGAGGGGGDL